jgi:hypothetical protein
MPAPFSSPAARKFSSLTALGLVLSSWLAGGPAVAQTPSPAAAAANADMLSWMARGLLTAVVGLTVLTCLVLLIAFTTSRGGDARPLAPLPGTQPEPAAA